MGYEGQDFGEIAGGVSPAFVETLYARFKASPDSVEPAWRGFFEGLEGAARARAGRNADLAARPTDDLTAALDPTQMEPARQAAEGRQPRRRADRRRAVAGRDPRAPPAIRSAR